MNNGLKSPFENYFVVPSLAIDPTNTQVIYAGSFGVFKSIDGGASWSQVSVGLYIDVWHLIIDPVNTQTIYVGILGGVYKSTNGGVSWDTMNTGLSNTRITSLVIDPTNSQIMYTSQQMVGQTGPK